MDSIKKRLHALRIAPAPIEPASSPETPLRALGPTAEEEKRYDALLERQASLVRKWRGKGAAASAAAGEKDPVRAELRSVLTEILDLREQVRAEQLDRLRRELDALEKAVRARQDERLRRSMVEARLRELLEERAEPGLPR